MNLAKLHRHYPMDKTRIVQFISAFEMGGVQSFVEDLSAGLADEFDITICAVGQSHPSFTSRQGLNYKSFNTGMKNLRSIRQIVKFLREEHITILHGHPGTISRLAGIWAGVPFILSSVHGTVAHYNLFTRRLHRWLAPRSAALVGNSNFTTHAYTSLIGLPPQLCMTIYNGVDTSYFTYRQSLNRTSGRQKINIPPHAPVIAWSGRMHPDKGIDILLFAMKQVLQTLPEAHLLLAGDGRSRRKLEELAGQLSINQHVHFLGILSDVRLALNLADFFVMPSSLREGFGLALVEAMAMGLPVIGTRLGGICEIIRHGENGLLVPPGEVAPLADTIVQLIRDNALQHKFAINGVQTAKEKFSLDRMVREYRALYRSLLTEITTSNTLDVHSL